MPTVAFPSRATQAGPGGPTNGQERAWHLGMWDAITNLLGSAGSAVSARQTLGVQDGAVTNLLYNPMFKYNQRNNGAALPTTSTSYGAGVFVTDMWYAGPTGVTLSNAIFSGTLRSPNITAGKLLTKVKVPFLSTLTIAWNGTALCSVDGGTPQPSPISIFSLAGGDPTALVSFGLAFSGGSVVYPRMAYSENANGFSAHSYELELIRCKQFYERGVTPRVQGYITSGVVYGSDVVFTVEKAGVPTIVQTNTQAANFPAGTNQINITAKGFTSYRTSNATGGGYFTEEWTAEVAL